ncbi:MAG: hypothetical protein MJZ34_02900 [Paludibacteraceae bacterium]|nr:hypothetical protein [Paludibacteraceae bacterium]
MEESNIKLKSSIKTFVEDLYYKIVRFLHEEPQQKMSAEYVSLLNNESPDLETKISSVLSARRNDNIQQQINSVTEQIFELIQENNTNVNNDTQVLENHINNIVKQYYEEKSAADNKLTLTETIQLLKQIVQGNSYIDDSIKNVFNENTIEINNNKQRNTSVENVEKISQENNTIFNFLKKNNYIQNNQHIVQTLESIKQLSDTHENPTYNVQNNDVSVSENKLQSVNKRLVGVAKQNLSNNVVSTVSTSKSDGKISPQTYMSDNRPKKSSPSVVHSSSNQDVNIKPSHQSFVDLPSISVTELS